MVSSTEAPSPGRSRREGRGDEEGVGGEELCDAISKERDPEEA